MAKTPLSQALHAAREAKNLTLDQAAGFLNVYEHAIYVFEEGYETPHPDLLEEMAHLYGTTADDLMNGTPSPKKDDQTVVSDSFEQWAMVELMGRRIVFGRVTEAQIFGSGMMRVDVPEGEEFRTFYYSPAALYCITPVTEELARAGAVRNPVRPIGLYDLALLAPTRTYASDDDDEVPY